MTGRIVLMCLVGFFAVVAGVNAVAIRAAVSTFGAETVNAYQAGSLSREIAAAEARMRCTGRRARCHDGGATLVEVVAVDVPAAAAALQATTLLAHPTAGADHVIPPGENATGTFRDGPR